MSENRAERKLDQLNIISIKLVLFSYLSMIAADYIHFFVCMFSINPLHEQMEKNLFKIMQSNANEKTNNEAR